MNSNPPRQEIVVTDIHMPFGSMVTFMVKWAIASIPALIILVMLGAALWVFAIGFFSSWGTTGRHTSASTPTHPESSGAEEVAYINKVVVKNITVGKSVLGEPGVFGEVKNTGERTLREVEITINCLGADGKAVFEKSYDPVLVSDSGFGDNKPLKPGYSRQFGVKIDDAPSDWTKKVDVKVSKVQFQ